MAKKTAILSVRVVSDTKGAQKGAQETASAWEKFEKRLDKATIYASAAGAGLVALGKKAIDSASRLEQSGGAVDAVFKGYADSITKFAKDAWESVGLSQAETQEMATILGAQLKNLGMPMEDVAGETLNLIELGADLAATFGGPTSDAVEAISSLLRGERDPIEKYGVGIKQATIEAKKMEMGLDGLTGEAAKQAEIQATLALLTEQTADAQGQAAREFDSVESATQRATARWENASAALGTKLLPMAASVADRLADLAGWVEKNQSLVEKFAIGIGIAASAIIGMNGAIKAFKIGSTVVKGLATGYTAALNFTAGMRSSQAAASAFTGAAGTMGGKLATVFSKIFAFAKANPLLLALTAVIAVIALVIANWDTIKEVAIKVWDAISAAAISFYENYLTPIGHWLADTFGPTWEAIKAVAVAVWDAISAAGKWLWDNILKPMAQFIVGYYVIQWQVLKTVAVAVWDAISKAGKWLWDNILKPVGNWISGVFVAYWNNLKTNATMVWDAISKAGKWLWDNILKPVGNWIKGTFIAYWNNLRTNATTVWNVIKSGAQSLWNFLKSVGNWIKGTLAAAWNTMRNAGQTAWNAIRTPLQSLYNSYIKPVANFVKGTLTTAWNTTKNAGAKAFNAIISPVRTLIGWLQNAWGWVTSLINKVRNVGSSVLGFSAGEQYTGVPAVAATGPVALLPAVMRTASAPTQIHNDIRINFPNYVGDRADLKRWLTDALFEINLERDRRITA